MAQDHLPPEARLHKWLGIGSQLPPEALAAHVEADTAHWVVVTEEGPPADRRRHTAYLLDGEDLPFWAFALAKSWLDDVGEWPLYGMHAEDALEAYIEHGNVERAVREIVAAITPVWPDVEILYVGEEKE